MLKKATPQCELGCVVPMHREVAHGTLRSALKLAGVAPEGMFHDRKSEAGDAPFAGARAAEHPQNRERI